MDQPDTSEEVQKIYDQRIRALPQEERFLKGLALTHLCRQMVWAGIKDQNVSLTPQEIRIKFRERLYGFS